MEEQQPLWDKLFWTVYHSCELTLAALLTWGMRLLVWSQPDIVLSGEILRFIQNRASLWGKSSTAALCLGFVVAGRAVPLPLGTAEAVLELEGRGKKQFNENNPFSNTGYLLLFVCFCLVVFFFPPDQVLWWSVHSDVQINSSVPQDSFLLCDCFVLGHCSGIIWERIKSFFFVLLDDFWPWENL